MFVPFGKVLPSTFLALGGAADAQENVFRPFGQPQERHVAGRAPRREPRQAAEMSGARPGTAAPTARPRAGAGREIPESPEAEDASAGIITTVLAGCQDAFETSAQAAATGRYLEARTLLG
jgi:hypothetical protein